MTNSDDTATARPDPELHLATMSPLDDAFCAAYPTVIDALIEASDHPTRVALWGVNRALHDRLNRDFYRTFVIRCKAFTTPYPNYDLIPPDNCGKHKPEFPGLHANLERYCHIFEVETRCKPGLSAKLFSSARNTTVLRLPAHVPADKFTPLPSNLVIKTTCDASGGDPGRWIERFIMMPSRLPEGSRRLVINCQYSWADQHFTSHIGLTSIPSSVCELVIHFKCDEIEGKRPRYLVFQAIDDDEGNHHHKCIKALSASAPVPELKGHEYLHVIRFPVPKRGVSLFQEIADLYASTIGEGEGEDKPLRQLKLTVVGLDEFDASRAADAADDEFFASMIDSLPWGAEGPPAPSRYGRRYYAPIAPKFVDLVAEATHESKRASVKENVRVLSREQYLAELGAVGRVEEDYWFRAESDGN